MGLYNNNIICRKIIKVDFRFLLTTNVSDGHIRMIPAIKLPYVCSSNS